LPSLGEAHVKKKETEWNQQTLGNGIYHQRDVYWVQKISTKSICWEDVHAA